MRLGFSNRWSVISVSVVGKSVISNQFMKEENYMKNLIKQVALIAAVLSAGCSSTQENPSTYGTGTDDLKKSPCAECTLEPFYKDGRWLDSIQSSVVSKSVDPLLLAFQADPRMTDHRLLITDTLTTDHEQSS